MCVLDNKFPHPKEENKSFELNANYHNKYTGLKQTCLSTLASLTVETLGPVPSAGEALSM